MGLDKNRPFPKRPRLSSFNYRGTYTYFITLLTKDRRPLFTSPDIVNILLDFTKEVSEKEGFDIEAYCFMPDHLHLLVSGRNTKSDIKRFVTLFKQKSGYWFKQKYQKPLWHLSYYDHVLRKEEDKMSIALYIMENPVRKVLVDDFRAYPYSGSLVYEFKDQG